MARLSLSSPSRSYVLLCLCLVSRALLSLPRLASPFRVMLETLRTHRARERARSLQCPSFFLSFRPCLAFFPSSPRSARPRSTLPPLAKLARAAPRLGSALRRPSTTCPFFNARAHAAAPFPHPRCPFPHPPFQIKAQLERTKREVAERARRVREVRCDARRAWFRG